VINVKLEPKAYKLRVQTRGGQDFGALVCITYYLDNSRQYSGAEFFEVVFNGDAIFSIPSSRVATFQEELRALHRAAVTFGADRSKERELITEKMREAYAPDALIDVEEIHPAAPASP
jgi:hypothetical protein